MSFISNMGLRLFVLFPLILISGCATQPETRYVERFPQVIFSDPGLRQALYVQNINERFTNNLLEIDAKIKNNSSRVICFSYSVEWSEQGFTTRNITNRVIDVILPRNDLVSIKSIAPTTSSDAYIVRIQTMQSEAPACNTAPEPGY